MKVSELNLNEELLVENYKNCIITYFKTGEGAYDFNYYNRYVEFDKKHPIFNKIFHDGTLDIAKSYVDSVNNLIKIVNNLPSGKSEILKVLDQIRNTRGSGFVISRTEEFYNLLLLLDADLVKFSHKSNAYFAFAEYADDEGIVKRFSIKSETDIKTVNKDLDGKAVVSFSDKYMPQVKIYNYYSLD